MGRRKNKKNKFLPCFLGLAWLSLSGCGSGGGGNWELKDTGTEPPSTADSETSDTGTADTGEPVDGPPKLPELCELVVDSDGVGQEELAGMGDGSLPDIEPNPGGNGALAAWAYYDLPNGGNEWRIQAAALSVTPADVDGGVSFERDVSAVASPAAPGKVAEAPSMAAGEDELGLVWRDGRWDDSCELASFSECKHDIAFTALNELGEPVSGSDDPSRITVGAGVEHRPSIAAVDEGYLVTWVQKSGQAVELMGARIDGEGTVLETSVLSDQEEVDTFGGGVVASNGERAVISWATRERDKILTRIWNHDDPAPSDEVALVSDVGGELLMPKIASNDEGFLVLWSARVDIVDADLFARPLDSDGEPSSEPKRVTWTDGDVLSADVAGHGASFAIAWASEDANGDLECAREECNDQIWAAVADSDGSLAGAPVRLSDDPNVCRNPKLTWDGVGWTAVWETSRLNRWQIFCGGMVCR